MGRFSDVELPSSTGACARGINIYLYIFIDQVRWSLYYGCNGSCVLSSVVDGRGSQSTRHDIRFFDYFVYSMAVS